jgi:hypothetical protein
MEDAVGEALAVSGGSITDCDGATSTLARVYAQQIDAALALKTEDGEPVDPAAVIAKFGPLLLACLESLLLSPRARANALQKGAPSGPGVKSPLDQLRERRARRGGAEALDPAAP